MEALAYTEGAAPSERGKTTRGGVIPTIQVADDEFSEPGLSRPSTSVRRRPRQEEPAKRMGAFFADADNITAWNEGQPPRSPEKPKPMRKFSIFRMLTRKSQTDKLIELYMSDEMVYTREAPRLPKLARTWTIKK
jgi:hypothetical protein